MLGWGAATTDPLFEKIKYPYVNKNRWFGSKNLKAAK